MSVALLSLAEDAVVNAFGSLNDLKLYEMHYVCSGYRDFILTSVLIGGRHIFFYFIDIILYALYEWWQQTLFMGKLFCKLFKNLISRLSNDTRFLVKKVALFHIM